MKIIDTLVKSKVRFNEPLSGHTTFRIGGDADIWFEPKVAGDLIRFIQFLRKHHRKFLVIGSGSNLLINDKGLDAVISLTSPFFKQLKSEGNFVWVGAGQRINRLIEFARNLGLGGVEFMWGIPGTVGGAVVMNAGMTTRLAGQW